MLSLKPFKYTFDNVILHTAQKRFCVSRNGGTGGGGWGHPQGAVHMAAVRLGCKSNMVGTGLANSPLAA